MSTFAGLQRNALMRYGCGVALAATFLTLGIIFYSRLTERRKAAEVGSCLRAIYLSLIDYSIHHKDFASHYLQAFPPSCVGGCESRKLSWRLVLFPYLEPGRYSPDVNKLCELAGNEALWKSPVWVYCQESDLPHTRVFAIEGPDTAFDPQVEFAELCESLIVLIYIEGGRVHWMDCDGGFAERYLNDRQDRSDPVRVCFADGTIAHLRGDVPRDLLKRFTRLSTARTSPRQLLKKYELEY